MAVRKAVQEISEESVEKLKRRRHATRHRQNEVDVENDTRYAVVLLRVAKAVDTKAEYSTLQDRITAIAGVQAASVLIVGTTPAAADLPAETTQELRVRANLNLVAVPKAEPQ
jgi:hypothetical protein